MDANLQSDFSTMEGFLRKLIELIAAIHTKDATRKLADDLLRHYKTHGDLETRIVPQAYADEIVEKLHLHGIPMMSTKNRAGDTVLILPPEGKYHYHYQKYIEEVFMHHPEYYKQLEKSTWLRLARIDEEKGVIRIDFKDALDAEIFKNKAFADGKGVVTTDITNADGSVSVFCRESDLINSNENQKDAISAIIDTEFSLQPQNQAFARRYAVWHDRKQADLCMKYMEKGTSFIIHDGADKHSDYLKFENNTLTFYQYNAEAHRFYGKEIPVDKNDKDAMRKLFDYYVAHIHNEHISTVSEFENHYERHSEAQIRADYVEKQKKLYDAFFHAESMYKKQVLNPDGSPVYDDNGRPLMKSFLTDKDLFEELIQEPGFQEMLRQNGLENIRPDFSIDFLQSYQQEKIDTLQAKKEDLVAQIENAKRELQEDDNTMQSREQALRNALEVSGISSFGEQPLANMTVEEIQSALIGQLSVCDNEMQRFVTQAFGNSALMSQPKTTLQYFLQNEIPVAHAEIARELLTKPKLSKEEEFTLNIICRDTIYNITAKGDIRFGIDANAEAAQVLSIYRILDGHLQQAQALVSDKENHVTASKEQLEHMKELTEKYNQLGREQRLIDRIGVMINKEQQRSTDIRQLDKECHDYIRSLHGASGLSAHEILKEVKQFLRQKGFRADVGKVTHESLQDMETQINQNEKNKTTKEQAEKQVDREGPDFEPF